MKQVLNILLLGEPAAKERPRFCVRPTKTGKSYAHAYTTTKTRRAEEELDWKARAAGAVMDSESAFEVTMVFHTLNKRIDLDNMVKLVLDSLNGIVWKDDRQVVKIIASKQPNEPACTELMIRAI